MCFFKNNTVFTITWLLCALSLVVDREHTDGVKSTSDHVSRLVFLFSCPQNPSINHWFEFLLYVYCHLWSITVHTRTEKYNLFVKYSMTILNETIIDSEFSFSVQWYVIHLMTKTFFSLLLFYFFFQFRDLVDEILSTLENVLIFFFWH